MYKKLLVMVPLAVVLTGCGKAGSDAGSNILSGLPDSYKIGIHLGAGETMFEKGQYKLAEHEFLEALKVAQKEKNDVDIGESWTRLGQTYKRLGENDLSREALAKANEAYEGADFLFKTDKRVWAQGLKEYQLLLKEHGDEEQAAAAMEKWKELREELGPMENLREKMTQF